MKYFVVVTLMICVLGVSSVFATQAKTVTSTQTTVCQTAVQNNSTMDLLTQLPAIMAKNTVKYFMPIESLLSVIPFIGVFFYLPLLGQLIILLSPIMLVYMIFGGLL